MNKTEFFIMELDLIQDPEIKKIAEELIGQLPDYFFEVAASSTGKYHPQYALGKGGLVRHTKAAVRIANDLLKLEMFNWLSEKKDLIITALLLHDGWKHGAEYQQYARADHPLIASEKIIELCTNQEIGYQLSNLIISHMGQWNTDWKNGQEILPKPESKIQAFVHLCDYLASRKFLEFNFEA